ncbi:MAG: hypothetical protein U0T83_03060 [Bacteriovoracaceae bacterium]
MALVERFALASNDAAILNMANFSTIDGLVTNDGDMLFVAENGGFDKFLDKSCVLTSIIYLCLKKI